MNRDTLTDAYEDLYIQYTGYRRSYLSALDMLEMIRRRLERGRNPGEDLAGAAADAEELARVFLAIAEVTPQ